MSETLKTWFRARLGVMIDLSPEIFGHYARDGTLMAKVLHSYDIINDSQLSTILHTHDPALCRVNLKHLKVWLQFIGVDCDNQSINEISNGKGCTALRLFYKLYLSLENKDRLHFITLQQEREKFIPTSTKFDVTTVSEEPPPGEPPENPLAVPLAEKAETIEWYREKRQAIIDVCKKDREKFKEAQKIKSQKKFHDDSVPKAKLIEMKQSDFKDIDDFQNKYKSKSSYEFYEDPRKKKSRKDLKTGEIMFDAMEEYLKKMKNRRDQEATTKQFKDRMQKLLLSEVWEKLLQDQENKFDEIVAKKVLIQSQYEKRIMTTLCEIRRQKNRIAANRQIVENLMQKTRENEILIDYQRRREISVRDDEEVEDECARLYELRKRLCDEKIRKLTEKHRHTCSEVVSDLVDIAIKTAESLKENDGCIPRSLWNEWKALFIKNQPIFESLVSLGGNKEVEGVAEEEGEGEDTGLVEEMTQLESDRQDALNNFDFNNYHNCDSPWDEYLPDKDEETEEMFRLGLVVLGYIVHRLLEFLYPSPTDPEPAPIPKVEKSVIVIGVPSRALITLQQLLEESGIRLIFMEDAINYCLKAYKEEMKDVEYINISSLISEEKVDKSNKKIKPSIKPEKISKAKNGVTETRLLNKQVQTPKNIPYEDMDPTLSDDAYIGKWTYNFLSLGEPISNELNTKILIQYLKSLTNIKGWAIVDYPSNYEQMASLEFALTGYKLPYINLDTEAEDWISTPPRITFEDENSDTFSIYRKSQLVPNPITRPNSISKTFMTGFIRVLPKPKEFEDEIFEILPQDATPMDSFYAHQSVAYVLYYSNFDLLTLKRLARLIIGDMSLPRKSSTELFGEVLEYLEEKQDFTFYPSVSKQVIPKASDTFSQYSIYEEEGNITPEKTELPIMIKPGEEAWEWANFPQPAELLEALAVFWENLESTYVSNLKDIFSVKRIHSNAILPYRSFIVKHMGGFISRPDIKQEVFKPFYREFNAFGNEIRVDSDFKCELQCRLADVQSELFEICDQKKKESEEERQRLIQDHWTAMEAIALINIYINITQVELDRCIDTIQMLQDYYNSMLQKPMTHRLPKILLERLDTPVQKRGQRVSKESVKSKSLKTKKGKAEIVWEPPAAADCALLKNELANWLLDVEKSDYEFDQSICCNAVKLNINYVEGIVNSFASSFNDMWRKRDVDPKKNKNKQSRKPSINVSADEYLEKYRSLLLEWRYATMFEIKRMNMRLKMLGNAVHSDITFLIDTMRKVFHDFHKKITDRYEREVNSVNEMVTVFSLAIEEERSIKEEMFFDDDRFVIETIKVEEPPLITEEILPFRFQMAQLGRLVDTLSRAAPLGIISRRAFYYILMDIITLGEEQDEVLLPSGWYKLENEQVCQVIQELFGSDCDTIDWREFIIYGMEIPMPSAEQLLEAKKVFEGFDIQLNEVITQEQFHSVPIWFYKSTEIDPNCAYILHGRNVPEVESSEEASYYNFESITGIRLPSEKITFFDEDEVSYKSVEDSEYRSPQERLRLMLVKELLSELFCTRKYCINYMELLFTFCKDEDPRKGLGKALALSMGNPICVRVEDGEKYVAELLELKQCVDEKHFEKEKIQQICQGIVKDLLESTIQHEEGIIIEEIFQQIDQEILPVESTIPLQDLDNAVPLDFQQSLHTESDASFSPFNNVITKESFSTTLVQPKCIQSPFTSLTEVESEIKRNLIYWIPKEVCLKVLTERLKIFSKDPEALQSIREELDNIYETLRDNKLKHEENTVLSHRLVNYSFMRALLTNISNFTTKYMSAIVSKIVNQE